MSKKLPKLVRDEIPRLIEESGRGLKAHIADSIEYDRLIIDKMKEEVDEFYENPSVQEAADIYEVCLSILENWNISQSIVDTAAEKKRSSRGSFRKGIVLEEVL